jgi:hypothetical protein
VREVGPIASILKHNNRSPEEEVTDPFKTRGAISQEVYQRFKKQKNSHNTILDLPTEVIEFICLYLYDPKHVVHYCLRLDPIISMGVWQEAN